MAEKKESVRNEKLFTSITIYFFLCLNIFWFKLRIFIAYIFFLQELLISFSLKINLYNFLENGK